MHYFITLILLCLPTYLIRFSIGGIPTTVLEILIYVIFIVGLWQAFKRGFKPIPAKIWLPILILIFALLISIIVSPDKRAALGEFKGFFIDPLLVSWLIFQNVRTEHFPMLFAGLGGSGLFAAIHTIGEKFLGQTTPDGRVIGLFGYSPNYVALFLAPITVMVLTFGVWLLGNGKRLWGWLFLLSGLINLAAIYFSGSRGGFLGIAGGLAIYFVVFYWSWIRKRISAKIIIVILILAGLYTSWTFFRPDLSASPDAGRIASSNNVRWQIWQTTLELGFQHPVLGVGLGNFQQSFGGLTNNRANFPEYITPYALTPHNIFLMFWLSTGVLGLIAFIWLVVIFYREALRKLATSFAPIILAVFSSIIIYGLVESSIWKNDLSIIFWALWSLIWIV